MARSYRWWDKKDGCHSRVASAVEVLMDRHKLRCNDWLRSYRLYGNAAYAGLSPATYYKTGRSNEFNVTWNVVRAVADTVIAKTLKNTPQPSFLTSGGLWEQQKRAKLLTKFSSGQFYQSGMRSLKSHIVRDAVVMGRGLVKIFEDESNPGNIKADRTYLDELIYDEMEAYYGYWQTLYHVRGISRDVALARYPEFEKEIKQAPRTEESKRISDAADMIRLTEAWHLPSKPVNEDDDEHEKHDGIHALCFDTATIEFKPWDENTFPFVELPYNRRMRGPEADGVPRHISGIQYSINDTLIQIQESIGWSVPKMFLHSGSEVVKSHLDDTIAGIIEWSGAVPPEIKALSTISPELFNYLDRQYQKAFEMEGISQLSATSQKPSGLNSGVAMREYSDIESERFVEFGQSYENFMLECADKMIRLAKKIAKRDGDYGVTAAQKNFTQQIQWKEIDLDHTDYVMQVFPVSALPKTPAGRLAMVQDLINLGYIDPAEGRRLLDFPDLEASNRLAEAVADFTYWQLDQIVDKGKMQYPEPFQDFNYAINQGKAMYLTVSTMKDVKEHRKQMLRMYIQACQRMLDDTMPQQQAPQMPQEMQQPQLQEVPPLTQ